MNPTINTTTKAATKVGGPKRPQKTEEEKAEYLALFKRSGMPVSAFCRQHGLCEQTFYYWRDKLRQGGAALPPARGGFAEVAVEAALISATATIHLNTGLSLELPAGADVGWVGRLVRELRAS
jgi:transposase-like protein